MSVESENPSEGMSPWESSLLLPYELCLNNAPLINHLSTCDGISPFLPKPSSNRSILTRIISGYDESSSCQVIYIDYDFFKKILGWKITRNLYFTVLDVDFLALLVKINPICFDKFKIYLDDNDIEPIFHIDIILSNMHATGFLDTKILDGSKSKSGAISSIGFSQNKNQEHTKESNPKIDNINACFVSVEPNVFHKKISDNVFFGLSSYPFIQQKVSQITTNDEYDKYFEHFKNCVSKYIVNSNLNGSWSITEKFYDSSSSHKFTFDESSVITSFFIHGLVKLLNLENFGVKKILISRTLQKPYRFILNINLDRPNLKSLLIRIPINIIYDVSEHPTFVFDKKNESNTKSVFGGNESQNNESDNVIHKNNNTDQKEMMITTDSQPVLEDVTQKQGTYQETKNDTDGENKPQSGIVNKLIGLFSWKQNNGKRAREDETDSNGDENKNDDSKDEKSHHDKKRIKVNKSGE